ncbi:thioredoxin family protein [Bacillus sp. FJAT-44742]|uniref:thioredoxin family protein n=1 Tax=Bacillus sp. FJAT-44742 TaxID=2014005 RepID=UPI002FCD16D7
MSEPVLPGIEEKYRDFTFYHADRDELIEICQEYDVYGIPSFIAFHRGKEVHRFVDKKRKTEEQIIEFIKDTIEKL